MADLSEFTKKYQVQKTLRFELIPQGKTLENLKRSRFLSDDEKRSENYKKAKPVIDKIYKQFIENSLTDANEDWTALNDAIVSVRKENSDANRNKLAEEEEKYRKAIAGYFTGDNKNKDDQKEQKKLYGELFKKDLFSEGFDKQLEGLNLTEEEKALIQSFNNFTTYFTGFYENRKNVFSEEDITTAIPHRIVQENFPRFLDNVQTWSAISKGFPELREKLEKSFKATGILADYSLDEIFSINFYNHLLRQSQIDAFNQVIGGIAGEAGEKKTQGLNETINLALQQDKNLAIKIKSIAHRFRPLYKQILSDRSTLSFIPEAFEDDQAVLYAVKEFKESLRESGTIQTLETLFSGIGDFNLGLVYVANARLTTFSNMLFENWSLCGDALREKEKSDYKGNLTKLRWQQLSAE